MIESVVMVTSVEVFQKIRELSKKTLNPRHRILLNDICSEISIPTDSLLVLLIELENRGLIKIFNTTVTSVSLTDYGNEHNTPPGGMNSEEK